MRIGSPFRYYPRSRILVPDINCSKLTRKLALKITLVLFLGNFFSYEGQFLAWMAPEIFREH